VKLFGRQTEKPPIDVDAVRASEFPWAARGDAIFLNAASTGPLPQRAVAALAEWANLRAELFRLTEERQFETLKRSRELCAALIGAAPGEIALATNTGFGINLAARALPLSRGDVILTPDLEFPANVYPWMASARARGFEYRRLAFERGIPDEEVLVRALDDKSVKCLALSWVGFAAGYRVDLERIGRACRLRNVYLVVDAIQGVGPCELDVHACNVDILSCGGQKWLLSPWGSGFVYVRDELVRSLEPPMVSWMAPKGTDDFKRLLEYDLTWRDDARRFEQISLPYQDFAGMNASLELLAELGHAAVRDHIARLADLIVQWAESERRFTLLTPADRAKRAGIVAVKPPDGVSASERLKKAGVIHSFREGAIRLAPHIYNTAEEVRSALRLIASA
jgi:cysteine desulfurase / selenocysteine lyase